MTATGACSVSRRGRPFTSRRASSTGWRRSSIPTLRKSPLLSCTTSSVSKIDTAGRGRANHEEALRGSLCGSVHERARVGSGRKEADRRSGQSVAGIEGEAEEELDESHHEQRRE